MRKVILMLIICTLFLMGCEKGGVNDNDVSKSQNTREKAQINGLVRWFRK